MNESSRIAFDDALEGPRVFEDAGLGLVDLCKSFGPVHAVDNLSLAVEPGTLLTLLGPSGCGKTTTLQMIAGLVTPTSGRILVGARDITRVPPHRRGLGMVFQDYALYPYRTVKDNVAFPLEMAKVSRSEIDRRVARELERVQLTAQRARRPRELSGGQQQRVALARALVKRPDLLLFDEPLSNLDASLRAEMRELIRDIHEEISATSVFVTHDQEEAVTLSDSIAVLRDGHLIQLGTPREVYDEPATAFVARFVGRPAMKLLSSRVDSGNLWISNVPVGRVPLDFSHENALAGVRPEDVRLAETPDDVHRIPGRIHRIEHGGADDFVDVEIAGGGTITARTLPAAFSGNGTAVHLGVDPQKWHVFDAATENRL